MNLPPDLHPGPAVTVRWRNTPKGPRASPVTCLPRAPNPWPTLPAGVDEAVSICHLWWPLTAAGLVLYSLRHRHGARALCTH